MRIKAAAVLAALLLVPQVSHAWKGGPWSYNSNLRTSNTGTYKATFTGENLIGVTTFGSSATSEDTGRYFCWFNGATTYGVTEAVVDHEMGRVSGVFLPIQQVDSTTATHQFYPTQTSAITGQGGATGEFQAETTRNDYKFVFKGTGHMSQMQRDDDVYYVSIVTGTSTGTSQTLQIVEPGWIFPIAGGEAQQIPDPESGATMPEKVIVKFTITGVRTSTQAYTPSVEYRVEATQ